LHLADLCILINSWTCCVPVKRAYLIETLLSLAREVITVQTRKFGVSYINSLNALVVVHKGP